MTTALPAGGEDPSRIVSARGVVMPRLLYGTAWKKERTAALVEEALRAGFRGIDTACQPKHYHEAGVGEGLAALLAEGLARSDVYLQTKFTPLPGQDPETAPYDSTAAIGRQVRQSFEASLRNLRVDRLDGLVLHSPYAEDKDTLEAWAAMEGICEAGGARQLGISNIYEPSRLEMLCRNARIAPAVVQNRFYAKTGYDRELRAFCRERNIIYQSFWTLTANPEVLAHPRMKALAAQYERSAAEIFFRFLTQQDIICLIGSSSQEHMRQDLSIFDFSLGAEECDELDALLPRAAAEEEKA
jgi:diketogulonate reductase-like aldo/keto reductase